MTKSTKITSILAATGIAATSLAFAAPATAKPGPIRAAYNAWTGAIANANCQGAVVSSLYAKNGILLATFDDEVVGRQDITDYFDGLTCSENLQVETDRISLGRDGDMGWAAGLYTFTFDGDDGETVEVPARFTFVFEKQQGGWMIVNHHSSVRPEEQ